MAGEVFISYRRSDEPKARLLFNLLAERGVSAWYDANVRAGEDWRAATARALEAAPIFVLLYSKAASESDEISKELAAATFSKKTVIPVRLENIPPIGPFLYELASRNWIDAFKDADAAFVRLADHIAEVVRGERPSQTEASTSPRNELQRPSPAGRRHPPWVLAAAGAAVLVAGAVWWINVNSRSHVATPPGRIAYFGIDHAEADKETTTVAAAISSNLLASFSALEFD